MTKPKGTKAANVWTAAEGRFVLRMRLRGESDEAIAAHLHRTPAAV